jgi:HlyD family type I secretion membrane fusion protein
MLNPAEPPTAPADDAGRFSRLGSLTIAAVFGGLLLWSVLAPVSSAVIAPGRISVETNRKAIQHLEGGVIADILVREGETVSAGDVLIRLDQTVPKANAALLTEQLAERIARQARLLAERDGLSEIPADSRAFALAPEGLDYATQLEGQRRLLAAREDTKKTIIALLEERIVQSKTRIEGAGTQIRSLKAQGKLIADELDGVKRLHAEGFAPLTRVRELEREKEAIAGRQGALVAQVAELESVISEARLEIERVRQKSREDATKEAEEVEVEIASLIERRTAALDALARTEIRAPEDGVVLGLAVHTKGGVIAPGAAVMEIVPKASAGLLIAAEIAPRDVDKVQAGQAAVLRFSAFNARTTPEATGVVRQVSADSFVDKATGRPYFLVLIDLPASDELDRVLKDQTLVPGMPVEAFIRTGARPAISYLLKPLTDALSRSMREE